MKNKKKINGKTIIIWVLSILLVIVVGQLGRIFFYVPNGIKTREFEEVQLERKQSTQWLTKSQIRETLSKEITNLYFYSEIDGFKDPYNYGGTQVFFRRIVVRDDLTVEDYIRVIAHELTHVKHQVNAETFATYQSIIYMLNSSQEMIRVEGWNFACEILAGEWEGTTQDCGYYLKNYLQDKNYI